MPLCTKADIEDLMSEAGVLLASEDRADAATIADLTRINNAIERAEERIKQYTYPRYDTTQLQNNKWVKWCCATFAAVFLVRRRGNPVPEGLRESYEEYLRHLEEIQDGTAEIPEAALRHEPGMVMSNLRFDARYRQAKVRAVTSISAGEQASEKPRRADHTEVRYEP